MTEREDLLKELKEAMQKKGFWDDNEDPFNEKYQFNQEFLNNVRYVKSDEQLKRMIVLLNVRYFDTASAALTCFKKEGLLKVQPTLITQGSVPSLLLQWGSYMHWFRGYYFQISDTHDGTGEQYAGADRLDRAMLNIHDLVRTDNAMFRDAEREIFVACAIPVLLHYSVGYTLLKENKGLVNSFLDLSATSALKSVTSFDDFAKHLLVCTSVNKPVYPADFDHNVIALRLMTEGKSYGLLTLGKVCITCTAHYGNNNYKTFRFKLPEWLFLKDGDGENAVDSPKWIVAIFVRALLALAGFRADWICMYPIGSKRGDILPIEYNIPGSAETWRDIDKNLNFYEQ